ncbi:unnamed protein product [Gongylonema pulchrum]|uniref:Uncharacterized protein n=1 Tax=Gongylonema pulchrum TaxID=637853 RepID=A0A183CXB1_9BILA|nr:unnamed protein product [Gongylonema pulchrum]
MDEFLKFCPKREFSKILQYIDTLAYTSIPDYSYLYLCLRHAARV